MADEEDDYMTMTFGEEEDTTKKNKKSGKLKHAGETSLQRRIRLERQGRERGHVPSKAELAKTAEAEREAALGRSLFDAPERGSTGSTGSTAATTSKWPTPPPAAAPPKPVSKGFAMMAKMGFVAGQSLGKKRGGGEEKGKEGDKDIVDDRPITEPIRIQVKRDRAGIGAEEERKRQERERQERDGEDDGPETKRLRLDDMDPIEYRDRLRQEREAGRLERQIHAAQVVAERMARGDEEDDDDSQSKDAMPLSDVNVLWRGLVKERRAKEHERAQRIKAQRLLDDRLRSMVKGEKTATSYTAVEQDGSDDDDDKLSYLKGGMNKSIPVDGEDDEEDEDATKEEVDEELDEFNALEPQERLQQVVDWMRQNRRYCFWCKFKYPDNDLEGCPGPTEEDHD